jgi:hypothetical protein
MTDIIMGAGGALIISFLIMFKSDKQSTDLLAGKLFRQGRDISLASKILQKHNHNRDLVLFMIGFVVISLSIVMLAKESDYYPYPLFIGIVLSGSGIWGRLASFMAADKELGENPKPRKRKKSADLS